MDILVDVVNQKLKITTNLRSIVEGTQKFVRFVFNLSGEWDNLMTFAQFCQDGVAYNQYLDNDNSVFLPTEIKEGRCTLMLYGSNEDVIGTTNYITLFIDDNILVEDAQSTEISTSLYNQLVTMVTKLESSEEVARLIQESVEREFERYSDEGTLIDVLVGDGTFSRSKVDSSFEETLDKADSAMQPSVYDTEGIGTDIYEYVKQNAPVLSVNEKTGDVVLDAEDVGAARKNGYYAEDGLGAATAEQIIATVGVTDDTPYLFRTSGGGTDVGNRKGSKIIGGSIVWNNQISADFNVSQFINGHKYYVLDSGVPYIINGNEEEQSTYIAGDIITDLTLMFGKSIADYIFSLEQNSHGAGMEFIRPFFENIKHPEDSFSNGEFVYTKPSAFESVGFNAFDVESGKAELLGGNEYQITGTYTGISFSTGQTIVPDEDGKFIPEKSGEISVTGGDDTTCVHLVWSGYRNGEYASYDKHTYQLANIELRGVPSLDENNNLYYEGDVYSSEGTITRKWNEYTITGDESFHIAMPAYIKEDACDVYFIKNDMMVRSNNEARGLCNKLPFVKDAIWAYRGYENTIAYNNNQIHINLSNSVIGVTDYTQETTSSVIDKVKVYLRNKYNSGKPIKILYELADPVIEEATPYQETSVIDDFGTERYVDNRDIPVPVGHETLYLANLRDKLQNLPDNASINGLYLVRQNNNKQELMPYSNDIIWHWIGNHNEIYNNIETHTIEEFVNPDGSGSNKITENNHIEGTNNSIIQAHDEYANSNNHVEGSNNLAGGLAGHVEGSNCQVYETRAHAGGNYSVASSSGSFAHGRGVIAFGLAANSTGMSAVDGNLNETFVLGIDGTDTGIDWKIQRDENGVATETEGERAARIDHRLTALWQGTENPDDHTTNTTAKQQFNVAIGHGAHAHGVNCYAAGTGANADGYKTQAKGAGASSHGELTEATDQRAFATGYMTKAKAPMSFTQGGWTEATENGAAAFGNTTKAKAQYSATFGSGSEATGLDGFATGQNTKARASNSVTFGNGTIADGENGAAFGESTASVGKNAVTVGKSTTATGLCGFAGGTSSRGNGENAFGFGQSVGALGKNSVCTGEASEAQQEGAFVHGKNCYGSATWSTAFGDHIVIGTPWQTCVGRWNNNESRAIFAVGIGTSAQRKNGLEVDDSGNVKIGGDLQDMSGQSLLSPKVFDLSAVSEFDTTGDVTIPGLTAFIQNNIGKPVYVTGVKWHAFVHDYALIPAVACIYRVTEKAILTFSLLDPFAGEEYRIMLNGMNKSADVFALKTKSVFA